MPRVILTTGGLTADRDARTVTGTLLPYGEVGRTNLGPLTAAPGVTVADVVRANVGHDRNVPVGRLTAYEDTDTGITGVFTVSRTPAGDALLAEVAEGDRDGLSVEVDDPVIVDGVLSGGSLVWCGFVTEPAFESARLSAADPGDTTADVNDDGSVTVSTPGATVTVTVTPDPEEDTPPADDPAAAEETPPEEEQPMTITHAAARPAVPTVQAARDDRSVVASLRDFVERWSNAKKANDVRLLAALTDITYSATGVNVVQPQWVGELWSGSPYTRVIVPLIASDTLTSLEIQSWRWVQKPAMAEYAGDKTPIYSNPVSTEPVSDDAKRYAGGHDVDRALIDFPNPAILEGYYQAMTESYARLTDTAALTALKAGATVVTAGTVPAGITPEAALLVDLALAVIDTAPPTFAIVASDVYRALLLTPADQVLALLSQSLNLDGGSLAGFRIVPRGDMTAGSAIVGTRSAATFYELGGGTPIRVQALNIVNGGVDAGVFGYAGTVIHDADGLAYGTTVAAPPLAASSSKAKS